MTQLNIIVQKNQTGNWVAFCQEMTSMWSEAQTIEEAVDKFKSEYSGVLNMFSEEVKIGFGIKGV